LEHRLNHIDRDVGDIRDDVNKIKNDANDIKDIVRGRRRWWRDLGIGAVVVSVAAALLVTFLGGYFHLRSERDNLRRRVGSLQQQVSDLGAMRNLVSQYNNLTTYALQHNKLSQEEVSRYVKGTLRPAPTGQLRTAQITDPSERSQVPDGTIVRGTISSFKIRGATIVSHTCWALGCSKNLSSSERTIWIVTQNMAVNRFYPQGSWNDNAGPVLINAAGEWVSPAVFMGTARRGTPILIHAMLVSHRAEDVFKDYLEKGVASGGNFVGLTPTQLPAGADILDTVLVFRK